MNEKGKSTLEKFKKILKVKNYSENTIKNYSVVVNEMLKHFNKSGLHLTKNDIENYLINYNYSSISKQNLIYSSINLYCKYILNLKTIPKINLERPRKSKTLPKVIDNKFIIEKINKIENLKHKTILSLTYSVGLRVSEVVNLKIEDIDSKRMIINIRNAKGNKDRIVPLSENILNQLRNYYIKYKPKEYLFNGQNKPKYSTRSCGYIFKKHISKELSIHSLRHSCFTNLIENGTDIRIIQKLAGHSNIKTTEIYANISNSKLNNIKLPI
jgi:site-specific recombinase XerD